MELFLASYNLFGAMNYPTRAENGFATAIDNIFIDASLLENYVIYPLINELSDHDAQLIVLTEVKAFTKNASVRKRKIIKKTDRLLYWFSNIN
jgi:hypothetical protein